MPRKLQKYNRLFLTIFLMLSFMLFMISVDKSRMLSDIGIWIFLPFFLTLLNGTYILGDAITFSLFFSLISIVLIFKNDVRYTLLVFLMFWIVRSGGEVVYWLNYQFATIHPHPVVNQLEFLTGSISGKSIFVIYQAVNQVLLVIWLLAIFILIKNWDKLGVSEK